MFTSVQVNGFRSLREFSLEIRPGLNVLVGPNGAGKTNIILFFEFLRSLNRMPLKAAIGEAGGIAQIFSKKGKNKFADELTAQVTGILSKDDTSFEYTYEFSLRFKSNNQDVSYEHQIVKIRSLSDSDSKANVDVVFDVRDGKDLARLKGGDPKRRSLINQIFDNQKRSGFFAQNSVLLTYLYDDSVWNDMVRSFFGRFVLNVVPSHVKKPEDSTREPGISSDGTGLSATLYAIRQNKQFYGGEQDLMFYGQKRDEIHPAWQDVLDQIRVAVPSITDIEVINDPFDNLLRCRITIGKGRNSAVLPLSAMSDGTVKWMSIVLRLATSKAALLLEEPENYLHPLMQNEIVRMLRNSLTTSGFMLLSTHSETLLNAVRPDELVVVGHYEDGTKAKRVLNHDDVMAEINNTGFGLGYYYYAEALELQ